MDFDLPLLLVKDNTKTTKDLLNSRISECVKEITKEIKKMDSCRKDTNLVYILKDSNIYLPNEFPIIEKEKTKWEKFAEKKGISKKNKRRKVFDDETNEYVPRYGPNSKKNRELKVLKK